jgi:hypothetical protein
VISLEVRIQTKADAAAGNTMFPEVPRMRTTEFAAYGAAILEGGMQSGETSVALLGRTAGGDWAVIQLSAALVKTLAAGVIGAEHRFADLRAEKN